MSAGDLRALARDLALNLESAILEGLRSIEFDAIADPIVNALRPRTRVVLFEGLDGSGEVAIVPASGLVLHDRNPSRRPCIVGPDAAAATFLPGHVTIAEAAEALATPGDLEVVSYRPSPPASPVPTRREMRAYREEPNA